MKNNPFLNKIVHNTILISTIIIIFFITPTNLKSSQYPVELIIKNNNLFVGRKITNHPRSVGFISGESVGFAAHSHLAGSTFYDLETGDIVSVQYEYGRVFYIITEKIKFIAVNPKDQYSNFIDESGYTLSSTQVYWITYGLQGCLILQTCYNGIDGRMFWIGEKLQ